MTRLSQALAFLLALAALCPSGSLAQRPVIGSEWDGRFDIPGVSGPVNAVASTENYLYVAGSFLSAGGQVVNNIAAWDGEAWTSLGNGVDGTVHTLEVSGSLIYAGGTFKKAGSSTVNNIAVWDERTLTWTSMSTGVQGHEPYTSVFAIKELQNGSVLAGGFFNTAGDLPASNIAIWNGSSWSELEGGVKGQVYAIEDVGDGVFVGGNFKEAGSVAVANVAQLSGNTWSAVSAEADGAVYAMVSAAGTVYVGGSFTSMDGVAASHVAAWNGATWAPLADGTDGLVLALHHDGQSLFAGGRFATASGVAASHIAAFRSGSWSALATGVDGGGINEGVLSIAPGQTPGELIVGGGFGRVGSESASHIATWSGSSWRTLADREQIGLNGPIRALVVDAGTKSIFAGGHFTSSGTLATLGVARWDDTAGIWQTIGSGLRLGDVFCLAKTDSFLFAGGDFVTTGEGVPVNRVARYSELSGWQEMDGGVSGGEYPYVIALAVDSSHVYVGGRFSQAGAIRTSGIARWSPESGWEDLGGGVAGGSVLAIAVDTRGDVYVGGSFTYVENQKIPYLASWNARTGWSSVGEGVDGPVSALLATGDSIWVGGQFSRAGSRPASRIAQFVPDIGWTTPGSGFEGDFVSALAYEDGTLYAGGRVSNENGRPVYDIARYKSGTWSPWRTRADGTVTALAVVDTSLFAGGFFTRLASTPSYYFGKGSEILGSGVNVEETHELRSSGIRIHAAYPNPFSSEGTVRFSVHEPMPIVVALYDVQGRLARVLFEGIVAADAPYDVEIDRTGLSNGVFIVRIEGPRQAVSQKVVVWK